MKTKHLFSTFSSVMVIIFMTILFQIINDYYLNNLLIYNRDLFLKNLAWQWITPTLIHANWYHWGFNILNLIAIILLFYETFHFKNILILFATYSFFILWGLYLFIPNLHYFVGMSGVLYGFAIYGSLSTFSKQKILSLFILFFIILKLLFPNEINKFLGTTKLLNGLHIITESHLYGCIIGTITYLFKKLFLNFSINIKYCNRTL